MIFKNLMQRPKGVPLLLDPKQAAEMKLFTMNGLRFFGGVRFWMADIETEELMQNWDPRPNDETFDVDKKMTLLDVVQGDDKEHFVLKFKTPMKIDDFEEEADSVVDLEFAPKTDVPAILEA